MKKILVSIAVVLLTLTVCALGFLNYTGILRFPEYDTVAPAMPQLQHPAVLVLSKTNGFIHREAIPAATTMLTELAEKNGWHLYQTDNAATHSSENLAQFDVVVWNNTSGDILTDEQRQAFKSWLLSGGQWLGIHAAGGDLTYAWDWYRDTLIAAQFIGHTMSPQFQDANVMVVAPSELTTHLDNPWMIKQEEWYGFDRNPRDTGSTILLALDESSYDTTGLLSTDSSMPGEHPITWMHNLGDGTVIYTAIGHTAATYSVPAYRQFISRAINCLVHQSGQE